jgi:hypothetical protein
MPSRKLFSCTKIIALGVCVAASVLVQQARAATTGAKATARHAQRAVTPDYQRRIEPGAIDIVEDASARLAGAKSMTFI